MRKRESSALGAGETHLIVFHSFLLTLYSSSYFYPLLLFDTAINANRLNDFIVYTSYILKT